MKKSFTEQLLVEKSTAVPLSCLVMAIKLREVRIAADMLCVFPMSMRLLMFNIGQVHAPRLADVVAIASAYLVTLNQSTPVQITHLGLSEWEKIICMVRPSCFFVDDLGKFHIKHIAKEICWKRLNIGP